MTSLKTDRKNEVYNQLLKQYDNQLDTSGVSGERLASRIAALSEIGVTDNGGVLRPGYSEEEKQAKTLVSEWMKEAGLEVTVDGAGNVFGRCHGHQSVPAIVSGSHVDSVPDGGNFDGVLGVLSALEVVEAWKAEGYTPEKPFEVAIFSDEEGSRFKSGLTGSRAFMGQMTEEELAGYRDEDGKTFTEVIEAYGSNQQAFLDNAFKRQAIELFVELHIEQGKVLEQEDEPVGIVSGIAGPAWMEVTFLGEAGHAGNTPMPGRKDALVAAADFISQVEKLPQKVSDSAVATIGKMDVYPNGVNVIPGEVRLTVDIRDIYEDTRDELIQSIELAAKESAEARGAEVDLTYNSTIQPLPIDKTFQQELAESIQANDIQPIYIPSGAGHDAMILGTQIPVAMLFVRSQQGISHHPDEWSSLSDCVKGVHVLKHFIEKKMEA